MMAAGRPIDRSDHRMRMNGADDWPTDPSTGVERLPRSAASPCPATNCTAIMSIARLLGRQIAREHHQAGRPSDSSVSKSILI